MMSQLPAITTPRLKLREMLSRDVGDFSSFMLQPDYQRYITMRFRNEAEVGAFVGHCIARQHEPNRSNYHLAAEEHDTVEVIGDGFLHCARDHSIEIGWAVHPAMWCMGLGTEIGEALLAIAFERLGAERCWCKTMTGNAASQGLARRIGMQRQKQAVATAVMVGDRQRAIDIYAITAEHYFDRAY